MDIVRYSNRARHSPSEVREELLDDWRAAIVRYTPNTGPAPTLSFSLDFWVGEAFAHQPDLSFQWLGNLVPQFPPSGLPFFESSIDKALASLEDHHRTELINRLSADYSTNRVLLGLVNGKAEVYRHLLENPDLAELHLVPLSRTAPDQQWFDLASVALDHGYQPQEIAQASFSPGSRLELFTDEANHWRRWETGFAAFLDDNHPDLSAVARFGLRMARDRVKESKPSSKRDRRDGRS